MQNEIKHWGELNVVTNHTHRKYVVFHLDLFDHLSDLPIQNVSKEIENNFYTVGLLKAILG